MTVPASRQGNAPAAARPAGSAPAVSGALMLAVLLLGQFMCIIDVFVVNVAMPSIGTALHASGASLQLVVGGFTIAYAAVLSAGAVAGLVLGGLLVSANLFGAGWRPVFGVNVPIGIVLTWLVPRL